MKALQRVQPHIARSRWPEQQQQSMRAAPARQKADQEGTAPSAELLAEAAGAASSDAAAAHPASEAELGPSVAATTGMTWLSYVRDHVKTSAQDGSIICRSAQSRAICLSSVLACIVMTHCPEKQTWDA